MVLAPMLTRIVVRVLTLGFPGYLLTELALVVREQQSERVGAIVVVRLLGIGAVAMTGLLHLLHLQVVVV